MNAKITAFLVLVLALAGVVYWQETRGLVATIDPARLAKQWFDVATVPAMDSSFDVTRWKAFASGGSAAEMPGNMRKTLTGEFASDQPAMLMLMDDRNFERLRTGYPPLAIAAFKPGAVKADVPAGMTWLVFFQAPPARGPDAFPTTGLQLGLALLKRLQESNLPTAHVTARLTTAFSVFASPGEAAAWRAKFRRAAWQAQPSAPPLPDRRPHPPQAAAPAPPSPLFGRSLELVPCRDTPVRSAAQTTPAAPCPEPQPGPLP